MRICAEVSLDPLSDIKAKIQGMLDALIAQENAEKGPDDFCSTELASNREKKGAKQDDADRSPGPGGSSGSELRDSIDRGFPRTPLHNFIMHD